MREKKVTNPISLWAFAELWAYLYACGNQCCVPNKRPTYIINCYFYLENFCKLFSLLIFYFKIVSSLNSHTILLAVGKKFNPANIPLLCECILWCDCWCCEQGECLSCARIHGLYESLNLTMMKDKKPFQHKNHFLCLLHAGSFTLIVAVAFYPRLPLLYVCYMF